MILLPLMKFRRLSTRRPASVRRGLFIEATHGPLHAGARPALFRVELVRARQRLRRQGRTMEGHTSRDPSRDSGRLHDNLAQGSLATNQGPVNKRGR
jgi:hypothetical protein